jgi:hypothetical protein
MELSESIHKVKKVEIKQGRLEERGVNTLNISIDFEAWAFEGPRPVITKDIYLFLNDDFNFDIQLSNDTPPSEETGSR